MKYKWLLSGSHFAFGGEEGVDKFDLKKRYRYNILNYWFAANIIKQS